MDYNESIPGLHDPISVPKEQRIARYAAHLREWVDFELAVHMAAISAIALKDVEDGIDALKNQMEPLRRIQESIEEAFDSGREGLEIGRRSTEKLMVVLEEKFDKRNKLVSAGVKGGAARAIKVEPLKNWAIQEAPKLSGKPSEKARKLMRKISPALAALSNDPERIMREAIRTITKNT